MSAQQGTAPSIVSGAAKALRVELNRVASFAAYLWPEGDAQVVCSGFSYTIPKEEQIRSFLYHVLRLDDCGGAVELEWNCYRSTGGRRPRTLRTGEIDLVRFRADGAVDLLEVKRIWNLEGWNNKSRELLDGIDADLAKLADARHALASSDRRLGFAGVFVASFSDRMDGHAPLRTGWDARELDAPSGQADFAAPAESRDLFVRFYFVPS